MKTSTGLFLLEVLRHLKGILRAVEKWVVTETGQAPAGDPPGRDGTEGRPGV